MVPLETQVKRQAEKLKLDLADTFLSQQQAYTAETRQNQQIILKSLSLAAELQRNPTDGSTRQLTSE